MIIDREKLNELVRRPFVRPGTADLRREGAVFFVGGELSPQETLGTVFESHCQQPAELVIISFGGPDSFHIAEEHARILKRNFHVHLMARFDHPPHPYMLERAYAAGVDLVDIPLFVFDSAVSSERGLLKEKRMAAIDAALAVFPAWGVVSSLTVGEEACCSTVSGIDTLLKAGVIPLAELSSRAERYPQQEVTDVFIHLVTALKRHKAVIKPLMPLLRIVTPLVPAKPGGILKGFIDRIHDHRLLAASDLRRSLRVKQVQESFESAGL